MKQQILEYFDKIVLGLCLLVLLWFGYSTLALTPYERTPEDFSNVIKMANNNVRQSPVDTSKLQVPNLQKFAEKGSQPLDVSNLALSKPFRAPFSTAADFREQPRVLVPFNLQVQANRGLLGMWRTKSNGDLEMRPAQGGRGIADEALARRREAQRLLAEARNDPDKENQLREALMSGSSLLTGGEAPRGGAPRRGMVAGDQQAAGAQGKDDWEKFRQLARDKGHKDADPVAEPAKQAADQGVDDWEKFRQLANKGKAADPVAARPAGPPRVDRRVINRQARGAKAAAGADAKKEDRPAAMEPIEDAVGVRWVELVAEFPHSDQIREYVRALKEGAPQVGLRYSFVDVERQELLADMRWSDWKPVPIQSQFQFVQNAVDFENDDNFFDVILKGLSMNLPLIRSLERSRLLHDTFPQAEIDENWTEVELNPHRGQAAQANPPAQRRRGQGAEPQKAEEELTFDNRYDLRYAMVRFWDFTVEPGKRYRYRVRVLTHNPNLGREDVVDADYARSRYLEGEWSEPSQEVYVPGDLLWYAAKEPSRQTSDRIDLEVHFWSPKMGSWVPVQSWYRPGSIIGLSANRKPIDIVQWNSEIDNFEITPAVLNNELDTQTILIGFNAGQERHDVLGEKKTISVPQEVIAVNAYGDIERRLISKDVADEARDEANKKYENTLAELRGAAPAEAPPEDAPPPGKKKPAAADPVGGRR